jgi:hypothetical protein
MTPAAAFPAWRPIVTAPRDGAPVLLSLAVPLSECSENGITGEWLFPSDMRVVIGVLYDGRFDGSRWMTGFVEEIGDKDLVAFDPTHWMPLPSPAPAPRFEASA